MVLIPHVNAKERRIAMLKGQIKASIVIVGGGFALPAATIITRAVVDYDGYLLYYGNDVDYSTIAVRPALWINLES